MDVEGFWQGGVAPLFVVYCMSRSAGSARPGAVLPSGGAVRAVWIRVYGKDARMSPTRYRLKQVFHESVGSLISPYM